MIRGTTPTLEFTLPFDTLHAHISEQQHHLIIRVLYMVTILQQMMDIFC